MTLFETYARQAAYEAHLKGARFLKDKAATGRMIRSLKLHETVPILLGSNANLQAPS